MLFNSLHFLIFFPIILIIANYLKGTTYKLFLLFASFYFYMSWNPIFIFLILASTFIDYFSALFISKTEKSLQRKFFLILSLTANLGFLAYFKYTNFFLNTLNDLSFLTNVKFPNYDITLPVGISFYTFQSMSYTIDVYKNVIKVRKSFLDFSLYIAFFPQLVAGPIVRASNFFKDLDQKIKITQEDISIAICQIIRGFVRKLVFADNLAIVVDSVFSNYTNLNAVEIWTGAICFGWQIYFDFAGYTDIAIGSARLLGFKFDPNFDFPMSVKNITQHWKKWHISFTTWIRDYLYIPLGGSKNGKLKHLRNIFITWLLAGLWHGAAYHYIAWGIWQAIMLIVHREYTKTNFHKYLDFNFNKIYSIFAPIFTMLCLGFGFVFFRAETIQKAFSMIKIMLFIDFKPIHTYFNVSYLLLLIICFFLSYKLKKIPLETIAKKENLFASFIFVGLFLLLFFGITESKSFLYFAF